MIIKLDKDLLERQVIPYANKVIEEKLKLTNLKKQYLLLDGPTVSDLVVIQKIGNKITARKRMQKELEEWNKQQNEIQKK